MGFGHLLDSEIAYSTLGFPLILPPVIQIIGFLLWLDAFRVVSILPDFFLSKRICIIHKGEIKKKIIFCANCNILYCERCYNYIMKTDKKCWFCKKSFISDDDIIQKDINENEVENIVLNELKTPLKKRESDIEEEVRKHKLKERKKDS